jgi:hypothetical protein
MTVSAREFNFYDELGIDPNGLRCVMLKTDYPLDSFIDPGDGLDVPEFPWANGVASDWHLTLRYGFLPHVRQKHVNEVLSRIPIPQFIELSYLSVFRNDDYECVVALVDSHGLREVNAALGVLPNIATFVPYKPHITIGYFPVGWFDKNRDKHDVKILVRTLGLEYGDMNE